MYFESRSHAGRILAERLYERYRYENCVVVALTDGGVQVAEQIAASLHCVLTMLLMEDIEVPGESVSFGGISEDGTFSYNGKFSSGEIDEYVSEFHGYLDEKKREAFQDMNRLLGDGGVIDHDMLRDHVVILVADAVDDGAAIDVALAFLKPIRIKRLVVATPIATVGGVDKLHVAADEIHVLSVRENFMGADHYYDTNDVPSHEDTVAKINQIVLNWR